MVVKALDWDYQTCLRPSDELETTSNSYSRERREAKVKRFQSTWAAKSFIDTDPLLHQLTHEVKRWFVQLFNISVIQYMIARHRFFTRAVEIYKDKERRICIRDCEHLYVLRFKQWEHFLMLYRAVGYTSLDYIQRVSDEQNKNVGEQITV